MPFTTVGSMSGAELTRRALLAASAAAALTPPLFAQGRRDVRAFKAIRYATAKRFEELSYDEVIARNLQVMDTAAFALCRDNRIPLRIYDMMQPGALMRILRGEPLGTLVH